MYSVQTQCQPKHWFWWENYYQDLNFATLYAHQKNKFYMAAILEMVEDASNL